MPQGRVGQTVFVLRISVSGSHPEIWRRIVVPGASSLHDLHRMVQAVLGWEDRHLYMFEVGDERYEESPGDPKGVGSKGMKLSSLQLRPGDCIRYVYDFGDDWCLQILAEDSPFELPPELPWLVGGDRAGPLEDSGGIEGYSELVAAHSAREEGRSISEEAIEKLEWAGMHFDPAVFDLEGVRRSLRNR